MTRAAKDVLKTVYRTAVRKIRQREMKREQREAQLAYQRQERKERMEAARTEMNASENWANRAWEPGSFFDIPRVKLSKEDLAKQLGPKDPRKDRMIQAGWAATRAAKGGLGNVPEARVRPRNDMVVNPFLISYPGVEMDSSVPFFTHAVGKTSGAGMLKYWKGERAKITESVGWTS